MKLLSIMALSFLSFTAVSQTCYVDMVDRSNRALQTFTGFDRCLEEMKLCRKTVALQPQLGGVDCVKSSSSSPEPLPTTVHIPSQGSSSPSSVPHMDELDQAINFALEDCHVLPKVSGWANQLYVNGVFSGNFSAGAQDMELRRAIRNRQDRGQCLLKHPHTLQIQFRPTLIQEAIDFSLSRNCYVVPRVSGWADQLFIDGVFAGNYSSSSHSDQMKLRSALANRIVSGSCQQRSAIEHRLLQDPQLIQDFANYQYRGCSVKLNVSGWANQLYVGSSFRGNFNKTTEVRKLQSALVSLIIKGTCRLDPL